MMLSLTLSVLCQLVVGDPSLRSPIKNADGVADDLNALPTMVPDLYVGTEPSLRNNTGFDATLEKMLYGEEFFTFAYPDLTDVSVSVLASNLADATVEHGAEYYYTPHEASTFDDKDYPWYTNPQRLAAAAPGAIVVREPDPADILNAVDKYRLNPLSGTAPSEAVAKLDSLSADDLRALDDQIEAALARLNTTPPPEAEVFAAGNWITSPTEIPKYDPRYAMPWLIDRKARMVRNDALWDDFLMMTLAYEVFGGGPLNTQYQIREATEPWVTPAFTGTPPPEAYTTPTKSTTLIQWDWTYTPEPEPPMAAAAPASNGVASEAVGNLRRGH